MWKFIRSPENRHIALLGAFVASGLGAGLGYAAKVTFTDRNLRTFPHKYEKTLKERSFEDSLDKVHPDV
jgi:hypothetical protein